MFGSLQVIDTMWDKYIITVLYKKYCVAEKLALKPNKATISSRHANLERNQREFIFIVKFRVVTLP